mmetsp:Transcript_158350/g.507871  ORF Transcript_158350/g.507871 Transcript_158350/m.507871 type:complete len:451 (+) Transcript_158350:126-1478(+)
MKTLPRRAPAHSCTRGVHELSQGHKQNPLVLVTAFEHGWYQADLFESTLVALEGLLRVLARGAPSPSECGLPLHRASLVGLDDRAAQQLHRGRGIRPRRRELARGLRATGRPQDAELVEAAPRFRRCFARREEPLGRNLWHQEDCCNFGRCDPNTQLLKHLRKCATEGKALHATDRRGEFLQLGTEIGSHSAGIGGHLLLHQTSGALASEAIPRQRLVPLTNGSEERHVTIVELCAPEQPLAGADHGVIPEEDDPDVDLTRVIHHRQCGKKTVPSPHVLALAHKLRHLAAVGVEGEDALDSLVVKSLLGASVRADSVCGRLLGGPGRHEAVEVGGVQVRALGAVEQPIDLPELYRRELLATCRQSFHQRLCQALISGRGGQRSASEQQLTLHDGPRNSILQHQTPAFARLRQVPQTHLGIHEVAGPTRSSFARSATLLRAAFLTTPSSLA